MPIQFTTQIPPAAEYWRLFQTTGWNEEYHATRDLHDIQLFSARGKREYYEKRGFMARPEDGPGMQYRRA